MKTSDIMRSGADTYEEKTQDYGSSWKKIGYILSELADGEPIVLETPEDIIAFGLFTRRMDKLSREFYGTFFSDTLNFEGAVDSAEDESVYASMSAENHYDRERRESIRVGDKCHAAAPKDENGDPVFDGDGE